MTTALTLESLGLSQEEITTRVVDRMVDRLLTAYDYDEDGKEAPSGPTKFMTALQQQVKAKVDQAIEDIAAKNVLPNVAGYVETLCMQETNKWGEKTGKAQTFTEYLVARAEKYLTEEVNYEGQSQAEARDSYGWRKSQTRVSHLVHKHLQYSIDTAMKAALANANSAIVGGLEQAVKIKLNEVAAALKVEVKTK